MDIDNLLLEIKKLKRMDFKLFSAFRTVINIIKEEQRDELLYYQLNNIGKDIIIDKEVDEIEEINFNIILINKRHDMIYEEVERIKKDYLNIRNENYELKGRVNYLDDELKKIKEKLYNKCFVYTDSEDTEDDHDYIDKITNSL
jgi:hypothetical protein